MSKAVLVVVLGFGVAAGIFLSLKPPVVRQEKLLDIKQGQSSGSFTAPVADRMILLLAIATNAEISSIEGEIAITDPSGAQLTIPLRGYNLDPCSWLHANGLFGFIIKLPQNRDEHAASFFLKSGKRYKLSLQMKEIPDGSSLWLAHSRPPKLLP